MRRNDNGVALIFTLGVLTLLMSLGSAFVMSMLSENRQTEEFIRTLQARLAAQAGVERAIAELRLGAETNFAAHSGQSWYWQSATQPSYQRAGHNDSGLVGTTASYTLNIVDLARQIYVNDSHSHLDALLQGLPGIGPVLSARIQAAKTGPTQWLPNGRFRTKKQLDRVSGIGSVTYGDIKNLVSLTGYQDPNTMDLLAGGTSPTFQATPRAPINVNTAPREVLAAAWEPFLTSQTEALSVADDLIVWQHRNAAPVVPMNNWNDYMRWLNGLRTRAAGAGITDAEFNNLRDCVNPNRKNGWGPSSATTVHKKYTTEFCFHSGGFYEIQSTGNVLGSAGQALSSVTVSSTAQIFKIFNQTKREQFHAGNRGTATAPVFDNGEFRNLTWADNCPVNSTQETATGYLADYDKVNDSLKLGFWDDFEDTAFSLAVWVNRDTKSTFSNFRIENSDARFNTGEVLNDLELHHGTSSLSPITSTEYLNSRFGEIDLAYQGWRTPTFGYTSRAAWIFGNAYIRVDVIEDDAGLKANAESGHDDVGQLGFRGHGAPGPLVLYRVYARYPGIHYWPKNAGGWEHSSIYQNPLGGDSAWKANSNGDPGDYDREIFSNNPVRTNWYDLASNKITEDDGSKLPRILTEGKVLSTDGSTYKESCIKFPERLVFELAWRRDITGADLEPPENRYKIFDFGYRYRQRRTYRLHTVNRINLFGYDPSVRLVLTQENDTTGAVEADINFPGFVTPYSGEITAPTSENGTLVLKNNGSFPSWDNVRVITPTGDYLSPVIDAGTARVRWGTMAWTVTIPASASADLEVVTFEPQTFDTQAAADSNGLDDWFTPISGHRAADDTITLDGHNIGEAIDRLGGGKGRLNTSGSAIVGNYLGNNEGTTAPTLVPYSFPTRARHTELGHSYRFLRYRMWMTSQRRTDFPPTSTPRDFRRDDANYLRQTPVLEDVTVTYIPRTIITASHEGSD